MFTTWTTWTKGLIFFFFFYDVDREVMKARMGL